jgi:hypothetical protein
MILKILIYNEKEILNLEFGIWNLILCNKIRQVCILFRQQSEFLHPFMQHRAADAQ